ncbi:hypothetical protein [Microbacterium sp. NPDC091662]|uniref:hypothetical protein n=1 Tax=Microbacterium sp. NPDC091662 TaxID=3364211 RepID=UPI003802BB3D
MNPPSELHRLCVFMTPASDTARRAERNFVAWPDAACRFGGKETAKLTNGPTAWFTVDR